MKCAQIAGFLIPRPCRNEASGPCAICRKAICSQHTVLLPDGGMACTTCAADRGIGPAAYQEPYRNYYGYDDFYVGPSIIYTSADYDVFDQPGGAPGSVEQADGS